MAGPRQPIELLQLKGSKHLTKAEIENRKNSEIKPIADGIAPPTYLTKKQKDEFNRIATQLSKLKIMGETDVDALARYITSQTYYVDTIRELRKYPKEKPKKEEFDDIDRYYTRLEMWYKREDILINRQEKYFKQCRASANDLGLSISSRCKLVVPETKDPKPKENKFKQFEKGTVSNG